MSYADWSAFLIIACFTAISPGAGAILTMSHALSYGWRNASFVIVGQEIALAFVVFVVGTGAGALLASSSALLIVVKILGATWLIYMGYVKWQAPITIDNNMFSTAIIPLSMTIQKRLISGFLTNITNVKTIVFMLATMPQFVNQTQSLWKQIALMAFTVVVVDTIMMHIYAFAASHMQRFFREPKMIKIQNRFFSITLILIALSVLFLRIESSSMPTKLHYIEKINVSKNYNSHNY